jgi:short-subunit dehydrogenase
MNISKPINIFITGATSGIGNALAQEYAKRCSASRMNIASQSIDFKPINVNIGLVSRRSEHLHQLAEMLHKQYGVTCAIYSLDVRDSAALQNAAEDFIAKFGAPDIVIANAGVSRGTLTEEKDDTKAIQAILDINVMGVVNTFQPFIAAMKQAGQGQLVGVASVAGIRGIPGSGAYSASKSAVITYLESLRAEMQHYNIHVSTIAPGYVRTPMTEINRYKMPFLMNVDVFAEKFACAVESKLPFKIIPWQMGVIAKIMRLIPPFLWDYLMRNAPHKNRINGDWL